MPSDFPFSPDEAAPPGAGTNAPFLTVSELASSLKATVESAFDFVRVRAEISRPTRAASGHVYFTLKDERSTLATLDVCSIASLKNTKFIWFELVLLYSNR